MAEGPGSEMSIVNNQSIMDQCRKESPPAPGPVCHCGLSLPGFISSLQILCPGHPGVFTGFGWDLRQTLTCSQSHIGLPKQEWGLSVGASTPHLSRSQTCVMHVPGPGLDLCFPIKPSAGAELHLLCRAGWLRNVPQVSAPEGLAAAQVHTCQVRPSCPSFLTSVSEGQPRAQSKCFSGELASALTLCPRSAGREPLGGQVFLFRESPCCDGQRPLQGPHLAPGKGPRSCCSVPPCSAPPFGHLGGKGRDRRVLISTGLVPPASSVSVPSTKAGSTFSSGTRAEHAALLLPFPGPQPCIAQHLTENPVPHI